MRAEFEEVLSLQKEFSADNTPPMQRRGLLIRHSIPTELRARADELRPLLADFGGDDADAEGRDGTGRKTHVPWVRWFSRSRSPSAQGGWYLVYLFHPDASGVSLCLSHGSTTLDNGVYVGRSDAEVAELMTWAQAVVGTEFAGDATVREGIELGGPRLARDYERTTVFSKFYPAGAVPDDDKLLADLSRFSEPLRKLYRAQELGLTPGASHPDTFAISAITAPLKARSPGQGRGLNAGDRKLVELRAMELARQWLEDQGFAYKDVSDRDSCDYRASRSGEDWVVEVKGTTGGPGSILLTANEVALHRHQHPRNALIVVHGIQLGPEPGQVSGGQLRVSSPWQVEDERLKAVCFEYRLP